MKNKILGSFIGVGAALFINSQVRADDAPIFHTNAPKIVDLEPTEIFIPVGFDDNDDVVAVVDGYLPDTCFRLRSPEMTVDAEKGKVMVQPKAMLFPGPCLDVTIPYTTVVRLGTVPKGTYTVATRKGNVSDSLNVKQATKQQPDDYLYAPVESAQIEKLAGNQLRAILSGRFTSNCLKLEEVRIANSGKTLEVLPIMKQLEKAENGEACKKVEMPFEEKVMLPEIKAGRHLLHVRTLNGHSVNEVFTQAE